MKKFEDWELKDAQDAVAEPLEEAVTTDGLAANEAFVEDGDHWQDGATWVGPRGDDASWESEIKDQVERQFTPVDMIGECLDRIRDALIKHEPAVELAPLDDEADPSDDERDEAEQILRVLANWWDTKKLWVHAGKAIKRGRWSTRGTLRFWVPPGKLVNDALPTGLELAEALDVLEMEAPTPSASAVVIDEATRRRAAVFLFTDADDKETAELWFEEVETSGDRKENPGTQFRMLGGSAEAEGPGDSVIPGTAGSLPIVEMGASLLVTDAVRRQQNRLNFFESLLNRNAETAGFPERYTLNAKPLGIWRKVAPTDKPPLDIRVVGSDTWYLWEAPLTLGAGITTNLEGIESGEEGQTVTSPGVVFRDPTDPAFAIKAAGHAKDTLLRQCKQGHLVVTSRAEASGVAYEQARADHENDLAGTRVVVETMLREFLTAAIAWAGAMSTEAAQILEKWRVVVNLNVNSGPISAENRSQAVSEWKDGAVSQERMLSELGVDDIPAEIDRLREEERAGLDLRMKQAEIITRLMMAIDGLDPQAAAEFAGLDPEDEDDRALIALIQRAGPQAA